MSLSNFIAGLVGTGISLGLSAAASASCSRGHAQATENMTPGFALRVQSVAALVSEMQVLPLALSHVRTKAILLANASVDYVHNTPRECVFVLSTFSPFLTPLTVPINFILN